MLHAANLRLCNLRHKKDNVEVKHGVYNVAELLQNITLISYLALNIQ